MPRINKMQTKINTITNSFKPKTFRLDMHNPKKDGVVVIGADIGYSAPKIISPGSANSFPSYAKKIDPSRMSFKDPDEKDIYIRTKDGIWAVGECAYEEAGAMESLDIESEMYSRNWYNAPMYKVLVTASLGLALTPTDGYAPDANDTIKIQTGLPAQYMAANDVNDIKDAFAGAYDFEMKVGAGSWERFRFEIERSNVGVIAQPLGSLMAVCLDRNGKRTKDAQYYFKNCGEIHDYGSNTVDITQIRFGRVGQEGHTSITKHAAQEILKRTCKTLLDKYGVSMQISELQRHLQTGTVRVMDRKAMQRTEKSFEEILLTHSEEVFEETFELLKKTCNYWTDVDFIIQTGGTYEAWRNFLKEKFAYMDINIVDGNVNIPELPIEFANAWGFFNIMNSAGK